VQHRNDTDPRVEALGVACDGERRFGRGLPAVRPRRPYLGNAPRAAIEQVAPASATVSAPSL